MAKISTRAEFVERRDKVVERLNRITQGVVGTINDLRDLVDEVKTADYLTDLTANESTGKLEDACRLMFLVEQAYDQLDEERKKVGLSLNHLNREVVPDLLKERKLTNIPLWDLERQFNASVRVTASVPDKTTGFAWLRDKGKGDLITETVNASSLAAFAQQYVQETQEDLPECFKLSLMTVVSVTKLKKLADKLTKTTKQEQ